MKYKTHFHVPSAVQASGKYLKAEHSVKSSGIKVFD